MAQNRNKNRNPYAGGTDTTPAPAATAANANRGKRGNRNRNRNLNPSGGIYDGSAGEVAGNQDPQTYLDAFFRQAGMLTGDGGDYDTFLSESYMPKIMGDYNAALAGDQTLSFADFFRNTYGGAQFAGDAGTSAGDLTGTKGKKGKRNRNQPDPATGGGAFSAGSFADMATGSASAAFNSWMSNQDPQGYARGKAGEQGLIAANGNEQFQNWYQNTYIPQLESNWRAEQLKNPALDFDLFMMQQDPAEARRQYAGRGPQQRLPSGQPLEGRWSWWG